VQLELALTEKLVSMKNSIVAIASVIANQVLVSAKKSVVVDFSFFYSEFLPYINFQIYFRYASYAQELEQHLEDDHPDRGDTQRSIGFFKSVAVSFIF